MKKVLFLILHSNKTKERFLNITKTWAQGYDFLFYSDYESKDVIKVTERDDYASAEIKQVNIINNLPKDKSDYEWYFFCDDDTFVNTNLLMLEIDKFDKKAITGQIISCWQPDASLEYLSGGAGFVMSCEILSLIKGTVKSYNTGFSDVTLGLFFRDKNIKIKNSDLFKSQKPDFYNIDQAQINQFLTFHYVKNYSEMFEMDLICK